MIVDRSHIQFVGLPFSLLVGRAFSCVSTFKSRSLTEVVEASAAKSGFLFFFGGSDHSIGASACRHRIGPVGPAANETFEITIHLFDIESRGIAKTWTKSIDVEDQHRFVVGHTCSCQTLADRIGLASGHLRQLDHTAAGDSDARQLGVGELGDLILLQADDEQILVLRNALEAADSQGKNTLSDESQPILGLGIPGLEEAAATANHWNDDHVSVRQVVEVVMLMQGNRPAEQGKLPLRFVAVQGQHRQE